MEIFVKVTAGILISAILSLVLSRQGSDLALLLTICVCSMVVIAAFSYLRPILEFARRLIQLGQLSSEVMNILFKVVGIGVISQVAGLICTDAGNHSLAKALQIITSAVVMCISIPLLEQILTLIETVMGEV